ncbi:MAG: hypothetical protein NTV33_10975 [Coprothermobacterota bacterium]|nr:hypothetical protein [Coprothermobacterota bacterium]
MVVEVCLETKDAIFDLIFRCATKHRALKEKLTSLQPPVKPPRPLAISNQFELNNYLNALADYYSDNETFFIKNRQITLEVAKLEILLIQTIPVTDVWLWFDTFSVVRHSVENDFHGPIIEYAGSSTSKQAFIHSAPTEQLRQLSEF